MEVLPPPAAVAPGARGVRGAAGGRGRATAAAAGSRGRGGGRGGAKAKGRGKARAKSGAGSSVGRSRAAARAPADEVMGDANGARAAPAVAAAAPGGSATAAPGAALDAATGDSAPLLGGAADAIVASLLDGALLDGNRGPLRGLRDAMLAEHADASSDAAARCARLREGFSTALLCALAKRKEAAPLLRGDVLPNIRLEVRSTAGRTMFGRSFSVGRCAECDVQAGGDCTVSRLQLIIVPLPNAVVLVDAWSSGGTRVVRRSLPTASDPENLPRSVPGERRAFVLAPDEKATLLVGLKTHIAVGPLVHSDKAAPVPAVVTRTLAETAAAPLSALPRADQQRPREPEQQVAAPAPVVDIADHQQSSSSNARPGLVEQAVASPAAAGQAAPPAASSAVASAAANPSHPAAQPALSEVRATETARNPALSRSMAAVRAAVRLQLAASTRRKLLVRCRAALRLQLVTAEDARELESRLRSADAGGLDDVRDILDGLGVPAAPDALLKAGMAVRIGGLEANPELNGTVGTCEEWLAERGRWAVRLPDGDIKALRPANLEGVLGSDSNGSASVADDDSAAANGAGGCPACVAPLPAQAGEARRRVECTCGAPARCSRCGLAPYHYHGDCRDQERLRERWREWLHGGRDAYRRLHRQASREEVAQRQALREAADARNDAASAASSAAAPSATRASNVGGRGECHFFTSCAFCGGGDDQCIVGPRFRCIHCPVFDCCLRCEPRLAAGEHDPSHVFEILFESEFDWAAVPLPAGTRARLRGHHQEEGADAGAPVAARKRTTARARGGGGQEEGIIRGFKRGRYELEVRGARANGNGILRVLPQDLQPLLTQAQAADILGASSQLPAI